MGKEIVIVTGACGRIGTNVVRKLGENHSIVGFELLKATYASKAEELVPVDLGSDESVYQAFSHIRSFYGSKITSVIHLAAYYSFSEQHSAKYEEVTVRGTERLLKALKDFDVEQFLFTSTQLVYAPSRPGCPINEDSPVDPKWDYPLSKVHTEQVISELHGKIPTVVLRIAGVYDDQCHSIPISHQIQRIYEKQFESRLFAGDLSHGAPFVHMDDLVSVICSCVDQRKQLPPELLLLIGEPKTLSYDEMQRIISSTLFGKEIRTYSIPKWFAKFGSWVEQPFLKNSFIKPWMIDLADDHYELDISRARETIGWEPQHSLEKTLPIMIEHLLKDPVLWYKNNGLVLSEHLKKKIEQHG